MTVIGTTTFGQSGSERMTMKGYSTLPKVLELDPHHWMQFSVIFKSPLF